MKKNLMSKMKLTRETLRLLENPDLGAAAAATGSPIPHTCTCCNTTRLTCSTVFC